MNIEPDMNILVIKQECEDDACDVKNKSDMNLIFIKEESLNDSLKVEKPNEIIGTNYSRDELVSMEEPLQDDMVSRYFNMVLYYFCHGVK